MGDMYKKINQYLLTENGHEEVDMAGGVTAAGDQSAVQGAGAVQASSRLNGALQRQTSDIQTAEFIQTQTVTTVNRNATNAAQAIGTFAGQLKVS
jgi:hypothetical protein